MIHLLLIVIYLAFISLGLPDALLGSAWPVMYGEFNVPVSYAGIVTMIIAMGTIVSSLLSDRITTKLGAGRVTAISVAMTAIALYGFSASSSFWIICLWAIPYGLGAGSVDAALNNYVALHYASRHMSWLHCMWGVGTVIGPTIMGRLLTLGARWNSGFLAVSGIQIVLTAILVISLPLWKRKKADAETAEKIEAKPLPLTETVRIKGAKEVMTAFFCYCALESTTMFWASSYMVLHDGIAEEIAAGWASMSCLGITIGRMISGFLTYKLNDRQMIRLGQVIMMLGIVILLIPLGTVGTVAGFLLIGFGCAPVYPCIIHSTPEHFGEDKSQAMIGVQMASAYVGSCFASPVFGFIANHITVALLPIYLLVIAVLMIISHESLVKKTAEKP